MEERLAPSLKEVMIPRGPSSSPGCSQLWDAFPPFVLFLQIKQSSLEKLKYLSKAVSPLNGDGKLDQRAPAFLVPCPPCHAAPYMCWLAFS